MALLLVLLPGLLLATACSDPTPEQLLADATAAYNKAQTVADKARADLELREEAFAKAQENRDESASKLRDAERSLAEAKVALGLVATDELLFREVQRSLLDDPELEKVAIQASVNGGVVRLTGSVPDAELAERAAGIAGAVPGVAGVEDRILVPPAEGSAAAPSPQARPPHPTPKTQSGPADSK
jgi:osmotically-inducible protein OsmY